MSDTSGLSVLCHLGAKTSREMDQDIPGRAKQGRKKISLYEPEVKRGSMGLLVPPFKDAQDPAKNTPGRVILR